MRFFILHLLLILALTGAYEYVIIPERLEQTYKEVEYKLLEVNQNRYYYCSFGVGKSIIDCYHEYWKGLNASK